MVSAGGIVILDPTRHGGFSTLTFLFLSRIVCCAFAMLQLYMPGSIAAMLTTPPPPSAFR